MWSAGVVDAHALRGQVKIERLKTKYTMEYGYEMSATADMREAARRATTWLDAYFCRHINVAKIADILSTCNLWHKRGFHFLRS